MGICYLCLEKERVSWGSYFCTTCGEIQAIAKAYGWERFVEISQMVCLRDEEQLEHRIKNLKRKCNTITIPKD